VSTASARAPGAAPQGAAVGVVGGSLAGDTARTFLSKLAAAGFSFLATVIIARALGPEGRGATAVALTLALTLIQLGSLGLIAGSTYFVARGRAQPGEIAAHALWGSVAIGGGLALALLAIRVGAPGVLRGVDSPILVLIAIGTPGMLYSLFLQAILLGLGRMWAYGSVETCRTGAAVVGLLAWDATAGLEVESAVAIMVGAWWVAGALAAMQLSSPGWWRPRFTQRLVAEMLRFGIRVYAATVLSFLVIRFDILLVNAYLGPGKAGIYSVAGAIAEALLLIPFVIGINLFPRVARGTGHATSAAAFRATAIVLAAACLISAVAAGPLVNGLFGAQFKEAAALYRLLTPGILALGLASVISYHFAGRGFSGQAVAIWAAALLLNVALNVALLNPLGIRVAPIASTISYVFLLVLLARHFVRESGRYRDLVPGRDDLLVLSRLANAVLRHRPDSAQPKGIR
jgi:O-antigen/teichoic acid export membrane protein